MNPSIYIYIYQTHINNQTQIAKEEEENAEIVEEQGVEEVAVIACLRLFIDLMM